MRMYLSSRTEKPPTLCFEDHVHQQTGIEASARTPSETRVCRDVHRPVQRFEAAHVQRLPVLRTGAVMEQPAADAGAAVGVFTGCLERTLQHVSTHAAQETLVDVTHEPLQVITHPATTERCTENRWSTSSTCWPIPLFDNQLQQQLLPDESPFLLSDDLLPVSFFSPTSNPPPYRPTATAFPPSSSLSLSLCDLLLHPGEGLPSLKALPYLRECDSMERYPLQRGLRTQGGSCQTRSAQRDQRRDTHPKRKYSAAVFSSLAYR